MTAVAPPFTPRLELLEEGPGRPVVVMDFVPFSSASRLGQLLSSHPGDQLVYQADPVTDLAQCPGYQPLSALADAYAGAMADAGLAGEPVTLVGYRGAAVLALEATARLAAHGDASVVLITPAWPDEALTAAEFARFRADLGDAGPPPPRLADASDEERYQAMRERLAAGLAARAEPGGLDGSGAALADSLDRYSGWLALLLASEKPAARWRSAPAPAFPVQVIALSEADGGMPTPQSLRQVTTVLPALARGPVAATAILDPRRRRGTGSRSRGPYS
jgi:thioesterase domain-containing protein